MDDWKLNTTPVVRLQRPSKKFAELYLYFSICSSLLL